MSSAAATRERAHGPYWLERHALGGNYYICWFDGPSRQTRRFSLRTKDRAAAVRMFDALAAGSPGGDPRPAKRAPAPAALTLAELVDDYESAHGSRLASRAQVRAAVKAVKAHFGGAPAGVLGPAAAEAFATALQGGGLSLGTASRHCGVLRAAANRAHRLGRIPHKPVIPDPQDKADREAAPPKGRVVPAADIARLIDAAAQPHLVDYIRLLLGTAARNGPLIELDKRQIDLEHDLIHLNPPGRKQTRKHRPTVRLVPPMRAWAERLPDGVVIRYGGGAVRSVKTAWRSARDRAGLPRDVTGYSIRYAVARRLRRADVPGAEISVQLGHIPVGEKDSTLRYSPYDPAYLSRAAEAIAAFYLEVSGMVTNPLW